MCLPRTQTLSYIFWFKIFLKIFLRLSWSSGTASVYIGVVSSIPTRNSVLFMFCIFGNKTKRRLIPPHNRQCTMQCNICPNLHEQVIIFFYYNINILNNGNTFFCYYMNSPIEVLFFFILTKGTQQYKKYKDWLFVFELILIFI